MYLCIIAHSWLPRHDPENRSNGSSRLNMKRCRKFGVAGCQSWLKLGPMKKRSWSRIRPILHHIITDKRAGGSNDLIQGRAQEIWHQHKTPNNCICYSEQRMRKCMLLAWLKHATLLSTCSAGLLRSALLRIIKPGDYKNTKLFSGPKPTWDLLLGARLTRMGN